MNNRFKTHGIFLLFLSIFPRLGHAQIYDTLMPPALSIDSVGVNVLRLHLAANSVKGLRSSTNSLLEIMSIKPMATMDTSTRIIILIW
jgi:hypothetical protein